MPIHYHLYCEKTGECVEAVAIVGRKSFPQIDANALGAFLVYHQLAAAGEPLVLVQLDSLEGDRNLLTSLEEVEDERESIGQFPGYTPPVLIWTKDNYRAFAARAPRLNESLDEIEAEAGVWKLTAAVATAAPAPSSENIE